MACIRLKESQTPPERGDLHTSSSSSTFFRSIPQIIRTRPHCRRSPALWYRSVSRVLTVGPWSCRPVSQSIPLEYERVLQYSSILLKNLSVHPKPNHHPPCPHWSHLLEAYMTGEGALAAARWTFQSRRAPELTRAVIITQLTESTDWNFCNRLLSNMAEGRETRIQIRSESIIAVATVHIKSEWKLQSSVFQRRTSVAVQHDCCANSR